MGFFSSTSESLGTPEGKKVILAFGNLCKRHSEHFTVFQLLSLLNLINILYQPNGVQKKEFQKFLPTAIVVTNEEKSTFIYGMTTLCGSFMSYIILIFFTSPKNLFQRDLG